MHFTLRALPLILCWPIVSAQEAKTPSQDGGQKDPVEEGRTVPLAPGKRVEIKPQSEISITLAEVQGEGSLKSRVLFQGPQAPPGYGVGSRPIFVELSVTAPYKGPATVCIDYNPTFFPDQATDLRILRRQGESWTDRTKTQDRKKRRVCAEMDKVGLLLMAVRTVEGLYEDLAMTVRQLPGEEIKLDLVEPLWKSREAALKGEKETFRQQLKVLREKVEKASVEKLPEQSKEWIQYFLRRVEARVDGKAGE